MDLMTSPGNYIACYVADKCLMLLTWPSHQWLSHTYVWSPGMGLDKVDIYNYRSATVIFFICLVSTCLARQQAFVAAMSINVEIDMKRSLPYGLLHEWCVMLYCVE